MLYMGPNKAPKKALEADSWLCNFIFSKILITHVYEKQTKKRLSLKTQFKIEFLLQFTDGRKVLEKMPGCVIESIVGRSI